MIAMIVGMMLSASPMSKEPKMPVIFSREMIIEERVKLPLPLMIRIKR